MEDQVEVMVCSIGVSCAWNIGTRGVNGQGSKVEGGDVLASEDGHDVMTEGRARDYRRMSQGGPQGSARK